MTAIRLFIVIFSVLCTAVAAQTLEPGRGDQLRRNPPPEVPGDPGTPGDPETPGNPGTPRGGSQDYDEQHRRYVLGEWFFEVVSPATADVIVRTQVRYYPDMSLRGFQRTVASIGGQTYTSTQPVNGRYLVQGMGATSFLLTITSAIGSGTSLLEILDRNRLRNVEGGYEAVRVAP